jgi:hypothetical protein
MTSTPQADGEPFPFVWEPDMNIVPFVDGGYTSYALSLSVAPDFRAGMGMGRDRPSVDLILKHGQRAVRPEPQREVLLAVVRDPVSIAVDVDDARCCEYLRVVTEDATAALVAEMADIINGRMTVGEARASTRAAIAQGHPVFDTTVLVYRPIGDGMVELVGSGDKYMQ